MRSIYLALFLLSSSSSWARPLSLQEFNPYSVGQESLKKWETFNGKIIRKIEVVGLTRSYLQAVLWMIKSRAGESFYNEQLGQDVQRLYNTSDLYDITADVVAADEEVIIILHLKEKWTLFPAVGAQLGGGSQTVGGGVYDSNFLGYFVNASAFSWSFNNTSSFDVNFNQEYWRDTPNMWSLDVMDNIEPQIVKSADNHVLGDFAWRRKQVELMLGTHDESSWLGVYRLLGYVSVYQDSVFESHNVYISIPETTQFKLYPKLVFGRVNWSNYLEDGEEKTVQWTLANPFSGAPTYMALELDYKRVWIVGSRREDNAAIYLSYAQTGPGGPNYIYNLGGYYNLRGYSDFRQFGRQLLFSNWEYRPLLWKHRWRVFNIDQMAVQGCLFTDAGSAWGDNGLTKEPSAQDFHPLWSVGAGFRLNFVKFAGAILRFDWAKTLHPDEGIDFSFGIGQLF